MVTCAPSPAAIAEHRVGELPRIADQLGHGHGPEPIPVDHLVPDTGEFRHAGREPHGLRLAGRRVKNLTEHGPQGDPIEHVAVCDVENLVGAGRLTPGPDDRAGQQVGVRGLGDEPAAAGKGQRSAELAHHGGVNADGCHHVHGAAERHPAYDLRPDDAERPG